ncbi:MAG: IPT/TIG domain-containing protein [Planctomycetota bacterium]
MIIVTLQNVTPNSSATLNGGELVIVRGTNFDRANVINVLFGGRNVNSFDVLDNERIEVRTPRAPGNLPNTVGVEVFSERAVTAILQNAYTYTAPDLPPVPTTIFPTTFTATGAETFTIQGTNLGPVSGTVNVIFVGAGTVVADVNASATIISGRAPITNMPPAGNVTVTVDKGTTTGDVPTSVSYSYGAPAILGAKGQAADGASRPVNLGSGSAVLCTAGENTVWGDADDEVLIVRGPPAATIVPVRRAGGTPVGYLDPVNSVPAVLDANTICVYSLGSDGTAPDATDRIVQITAAQTTPVVTDHAGAFLNPAPLGAIGPNRVATMVAGTNTTLGDADDRIWLIEFSGTTLNINSKLMVGAADLTGGRGNLSIPYSPDGSAVFVLTGGTNTTFRDNDDVFRRITMPGLQTIVGVLPAPFGRPIAISASLAAVPAAGPNGLFGDTNDELCAIQIGATMITIGHTLPTPLSVGPLVPFAKIGDGIVIPLTGVDGTPNTFSDEFAVYTDPVAGTVQRLSRAGIPLFAPLGNGELIVFERGGDVTPDTNDDAVTHIDAAAQNATSFATAPIWDHAFAPHTDQTRAFAIDAGANGFGDGDEALLIYQAASLGQFVESLALVMAQPGTPATGLEPFVPIGPGWGLIQSPGLDGTYGGADDQLLLVRY